MIYFKQPHSGHPAAGGPTSVAATGTPSYASFPILSPYSASSTHSPPRQLEPAHLYGQSSFHHERDGFERSSAPGTPHQRSARPVYAQLPAGPPRLPTSLNAQSPGISGMQYPATPFPGQTMNGMLPVAAGPMGMGMGMPSPMFQTPGAFYRDLGYQYHMNRPEYQPEPGWSGWDFAQAIGGGRLERSWFDDMAARDAHRRIYHEGEIHPRYGFARFDGVNNKVLGGAAAFEAFLIWDRHHYEQFHSEPTASNRDRLVGLAISHVYALFDRFQIPEEAPGRHGRSLRLRDACEVAAATAKSLFEDHYDPQQRHAHSHHGRDESYASHHRGGSMSDREFRREERERERERERMMRMGGYGGAGGMPMGAGGMPGIMPGGYSGMPGGQGGYAHLGHHNPRHHHHRDDFDSDEEDHARMRADGMYRSQYGGGSGMYGGMPNPGMIPTMAQQAAMFSGGMRVPPPMTGYGAPAGANFNQMAAMQNGMMGQNMMGQAGMMNPMMAGQMLNPAMSMNGMAGMQGISGIPGMGMGMGVPGMAGQLGMGMPGMLQGNPAMYEAAQMSANMGGAQAMPGMHVRDAERMVDPAFYNGGGGTGWYNR